MILGPGSGVRRKNSSTSMGSSFLMMSMSRAIVSGVSVGSPGYIPRTSHAGAPPGQQHLAVFPNLVLSLFRARQGFPVDGQAR